MHGSIHHLDITVSDLERSTEFYNLTLPLMGFRRSLNVPEGPIWSTSDCEIGLVAAHPSSRQKHDRYSPGLHHLAFSAPSRKSVDALYDWLIYLDVQVLDAPADYPQYAPEYYAVFFADPDGIKLEYTFTPQWPT